ncbi:AP3-complex subunit beta-A [Abeliophyllum distichum]|uniref:AP3-complex subunit beta-A n=1 Tax=Abeliophyllum distichum TaxID=126358 RepID=A0ABD1PRK7_9LAMI
MNLEAMPCRLRRMTRGTNTFLHCLEVLLRAKGEDLSILRKIVGYLLELAKCDFSYDVRDRARILKNLLSHRIESPYLEEVKDQPEIEDLTHVLTESIFGGQTKPPSCEPLSYRFYLPGSLSQIVLHAAPGYEPLPEPHSLIYDESCNISTDVQGIKTSGVGVAHNEPNENDDSEAVSGSSDKENTSDYSLQESMSGSSESGGSGSASDVNDNAGPLIHLSDDDLTHRNRVEVSEENDASGSNGVDELMSKRDLESWLDENPGLNQNSLDLGHVQRSLARISIKDFGGLVKPKSYTLLDPANGNGLSVDYTFSSEVSSISPLLVCLHVSFRNYSKEPMSDILLFEEESNRRPDSSDQSVSERCRCMLRTQGSNLEIFDPEIERTFRRRRKEHNQKQKNQQRIQMADAQLRREAEVAAMEAARLAAQQIQPHNVEEEDDDGNMPMAQF